MYFDEAHTLTTQSSDTSSNTVQRNLFDSLIGSLDTFRDLPIFVIFLSTQSKIEHFAPALQLARSARYRLYIKMMHSPITETPFDCFGKRPLVVQRLLLGHLDDIVFMCLFGRPLYAIDFAVDIVPY
jgi:hypothetical protein